ncbi:unnamed protein product [Amaranthus hypochondriacus]
MESNLTLGNMMSSYGGSDLQGSMRVNHHQNPSSLQQQHHHSQPVQGLMNHPSNVFPVQMGQGHKCDHPKLGGDYKVEKGKNSATDEDELSSNEEGVEGQCDPCKGKRVAQWQRVKWTNSMVKLLITAVSYLSEESSLEGCTGGRRKFLNLHKKGKWKSVSIVMAERGFFVSPQQCEDKFNDLNKRYKKLNDILGKGTTCQVVEKPALLDMMEHLSEKTKDEVRKILSSKHLFYEEMCSYHNNNRLHLPHDPALQMALQLALRSRDDNDPDSRRDPHEDDEDDHDVETDDHEEYEETYSRRSRDPFKRMKQGLGLENFNFGAQSTQDYSKGFQLQSHNQCAENPNAASLQMQWLRSQSLHLEEQRLKIELETLELEKERFKWQRFCKRKDRELEKLKTENDKMRLENERISLELKRMEMSVKNTP